MRMRKQTFHSRHFFSLQYLERRFDRSVRLFGSIMFSIMNVCKCWHLLSIASRENSFRLSWARTKQLHQTNLHQVQGRSLMWIRESARKKSRSEKSSPEWWQQLQSARAKAFFLLVFFLIRWSVHWHVFFSHSSVSTDRDLHSVSSFQPSHGRQYSRDDMVCCDHLRVLHLCRWIEGGCVDRCCANILNVRCFDPCCGEGNSRS